MTTYLAGPMAGCSDQEMFGWRQKATILLGGDVLDPTVRDYRGVDGTQEQVAFIIHSDKDDIMNADTVLAYCPRPSYGTVMEIIFSWERGKTVVVVVPPGNLNSPWLRYHSHIILESVEEACNYILNETLANQNRKEKTKTMSANKLRYYNVVQTTVVKANNKADALSLAQGRRGVLGQALQRSTEVERIPATEANSLAQSA